MFKFGRSGTRQIKDSSLDDSPSGPKGTRAKSSPKSLQQINPLNTVFVPGDVTLGPAPILKLPDFK